MPVKLLLDNSAWARLGNPRLPQTRANEIADAIEARRIATCLPFLLEAGYSARSGHDHVQLLRQLRGLPHFAIDDEVEGRSLEAQARLAEVGHHRLPPVDLLIGAIADRHDLGVLHYDTDYDLLRRHTDLAFESVWLAPRGSL